MDYVVIAFLLVSILLYLLLGGADFGAGIIELFTSPANRKRTRKTLYQAIGPIWEANHMWLIIAIVILFVGFPEIYRTMSVYLHIPLLIMLLGIIARGTAFVFRHYDAVKDEMQWLYNRIFIFSSFITPFFLGVIAGSVVSGHVDVGANDFLTAYVWSWLNTFSISVGLFTVALCGLLAAVYLIGEADDGYDKQRFVRKAKFMNVASLILGAFVFIAAAWDDIPLVSWAFTNTVGRIAMAVAVLCAAVLWYFFSHGKSWIIRILAAVQVTMILLAISYAHFPDFIILTGGENLSLLQHQAADKTMNALGWALILGSVFILPALFYLFYSFQKFLLIAPDNEKS